VSTDRWFVWAGRAGFGFRLGIVEVQVYFYAPALSRTEERP
jgi:hypothetical protein